MYMYFYHVDDDDKDVIVEEVGVFICFDHDDKAYVVVERVAYLLHYNISMTTVVSIYNLLLWLLNQVDYLVGVVAGRGL